MKIDRFDQTFFEKFFFAKIDLKSVQFVNLKSKKFFDQKFRSKMVKNGQKWSKMVKNGQKWSKMIKNCQGMENISAKKG